MKKKWIPQKLRGPPPVVPLSNVHFPPPPWNFHGRICVVINEMGTQVEVVHGLPEDFHESGPLRWL